MTAHELARKLLAGPDIQVVFEDDVEDQYVVEAVGGVKETTQHPNEDWEEAPYAEVYPENLKYVGEDMHDMLVPRLKAGTPPTRPAVVLK